MVNAESELQKANNDRGAALRFAQADLEKAKHDAQASIDFAIRELQATEGKINREFDVPQSFYSL
jgi:hypothetical protein